MFAVQFNLDNEVMTLFGQGAGAVATLVTIALTVRRYGRFVFTSVKLAIVGIVLASMLLSGWVSARMVNSTTFDAKVGDYITAAYKSEDKGRAKKYLTAAIDYLKETGRNKGFAAVFAGGQGDDLEEWCADLEGVRDSLDNPMYAMRVVGSDVQAVSLGDALINGYEPIPAPTPTKEELFVKSEGWKNRLKKFVIFKSNSQEVDGIKYPSGISVAPYNSHYAAWVGGGTALLLFSFGCLCFGIVKKNRLANEADAAAREAKRVAEVNAYAVATENRRREALAQIPGYAAGSRTTIHQQQPQQDVRQSVPVAEAVKPTTLPPGLRAITNHSCDNCGQNFGSTIPRSCHQCGKVFE